VIESCRRISTTSRIVLPQLVLPSSRTIGHGDCHSLTREELMAKKSKDGGSSGSQQTGKKKRKK
jgi:hypothetical protein